MKNSHQSPPSPFVYWAQTEKVVSMRIDLKNVVNPDLVVLEDKVQFSADGVGAHGRCKYKFCLDLYSAIKTDTSSDEKPATVRVLDNRVDVVIQKEKPAVWPRLTAQPQKPAWLKINFDLWKPEDAKDSDEECRDIMKDYPGMYDKLQKEEMGYRREDFIKVYIILYNLCQLTGYLYVLTVMGVRYAKLGYASVPSTYDHVGKLMKFLQLLQLMDTVHPLIGYTRGSALVPFFQVLGRILITCFTLEFKRMQSMPAVFYLFIAWSLVEIVRCTYYVTQLCKVEIGIIKWLRYSFWIILYPWGLTCELIIVLRTIPYVEEAKMWLTLPNPWNFTFDFVFLLKLYFVVLIASGAFLMNYMYTQRKLRLRSKVLIKKCK